MGVPWSEQGNGGSLTKTQAAYLAGIGRFAQEEGHMPTVIGLARWYGVSRQAAHKVVYRLRAKGYLAGTKRGQMTLTDKGRQALGAGQ